MGDGVLIFLSASTGAAMQELLYWYEIYKSLDFAKYQSLIRSRPYWMIVAGLVLITGIVALFWFGDEGHASNKRDVFVFGISLPLIVKQLMRARPEQIKLGGKGVSYFDVR